MSYNYQPYQQNQVFMPQGSQYNPQAMPMQNPMQYTQPMPDRLAQMRQEQQYPYQASQQPSLIRVLSEAEAQSYPVAFGCSVAMLDAHQPKMYIKTMDGVGNPSFVRYRLIEERDEPQIQQMPQNMNELYVTRQEYMELTKEHERVMDAITKIAERLGLNDNE